MGIDRPPLIDVVADVVVVVAVRECDLHAAFEATNKAVIRWITLPAVALHLSLAHPQHYSVPVSVGLAQTETKKK